MTFQLGINSRPFANLIRGSVPGIAGPSWLRAVTGGVVAAGGALVGLSWEQLRDR